MLQQLAVNYMNANGNFGLTPKKNKLDDGLKLINSPTQKIEDLYQRLINVSPPRRFLIYNQIPSSQIEQQSPSSSQMIQQELQSSIVGNENIEMKQEDKQKSQQCTIRKIITPRKASKGCHCQKSHCLKKYCDCFKIGQICGDDCLCVGCQNSEMTDRHTQQVKLVQLTRSGKGGKQLKCNCQKSHCLKNYCQCHSARRICSSLCNCLQCQNKLQLSTRGKKKKHLQISTWDLSSLRKDKIVLFH